MTEKILLIDDDYDVLETNEQILTLFGYTVVTSSDSKRGLELYKEIRPCMVFSDVKMPDMDGYELFAKIREIDSSAKVILLTGHENKAQSFLAKQNGLLDVIHKPIDTDTLKNIINKNNC